MMRVASSMHCTITVSRCHLDDISKSTHKRPIVFFAEMLKRGGARDMAAISISIKFTVPVTTSMGAKTRQQC